ncbi:hypothetical protein ABRP62_01470 [Corynebacterium sp. KPL2636]|uniref:hypothetical protein n=1 Tax=Corynebacterium sp. KPL2636 TaxID=3158309 RepID=UPI0032EEA260
MPPRRGMTKERAERAAKVVTLHDGGATFEVIGKQLGISKTQARLDYDKAMDEAKPDAARTVFAKLDRRYNRLHAAYWKKALDGDIKAARLIIDVNTKLAALWGVEGAIKLDVEVTGGEEFSSMITNIRQTIAAEAEVADSDDEDLA